jgi:short-subunit dehydrogenase
MRSSFLEFSL